MGSSGLTGRKHVKPACQRRVAAAIVPLESWARSGVTSSDTKPSAAPVAS